MQPRYRFNQGFTLIEAVIVILIIGILSAITIPNWLAFINVRRLNNAQEQVYLAMRLAQSNAKQQKSTWQVSFQEVANQDVQWAIHPATVEPARASWKKLEPPVRLDAETSLELKNGVRQIQFDYKGNIRKPPFGRITLSIKKGGKFKRCVIVSTILGAMRTAKEHPKPKEGRYCY